MNIEEIKVGEMYNVRVRVIEKKETVFRAKTLSPNGELIDSGLFVNSEAAAFSPATNEPKYDPCRKFRKGDNVRIVQYKGRDYDDFAKEERGKTLEVQSDEEEHCNIMVRNSDGEDFAVDPAYLKLLTPVEELKQHHVETHGKSVYVKDKEGEVLACYHKFFHPYAREAAEAECDRLNKEHGKKHNNDQLHTHEPHKLVGRRRLQMLLCI